MEKEIGLSPVLAPKQNDDPKEEPADNSPLKPIPSGYACGALSASKCAKGNIKTNGDDTQATNDAPPKIVKTECVMFNFCKCFCFIFYFFTLVTNLHY